MRKLEEEHNRNSCWNKAYDFEFIFVLLARDPSAVVAVEAWIEDRISIGKNKPDDEKIQDARRWIEDVKAERENYGAT